MITSFYAGLLSVFYVVLALNVVRFRRKFNVSLGDNNQEELQRAIRVHSNFAEFVPLALILLFLVETSIGSDNPTLIHMIGIVLFIARVFHAYGVNSGNKKLRYRAIGMLLTLLTMLTMAFYLILSALF